MLIHCPNCGHRYLSEFSYEGDASVVRVTTQQQSSDNDSQNSNDSTPIETEQAWFDYVYARKNQIDNHHELWHHVAACRAFFVVNRNIKTHEIKATYTMQEYRQLQSNEDNNNGYDKSTKNTLVNTMVERA